MWNCLKLNYEKTEMMIAGQNHLVVRIDGVRELCMGDIVVKPSSGVHNIGATIKSEMRMLKQVCSAMEVYEVLIV